MKSEDVRRAEEKIEKVMFQFFYDDGILFQAFCLLKKVADPKQDTIGINLLDKHPRLTYNPNFVNITHPEVLETILIAEGLRVLLRHISSRLKEPRSVSYMSSSMAICSLMNNDIEKLLSGIKIGDFLTDPETFKFEQNKSHEEYFSMLSDIVDDVRKHIMKFWPNNEEMSDLGDGDGDDGDGEKGRDSDGFKSYSNQKEALHEYKNPMGTNAQGWGDDHDDHFDVAVSTLVTSNRGSAKHWGKCTGKMKEDILAAFTPKVNPKDVLKRFYKSVMASVTNSTRMKVNRRLDLLLPGKRSTYRTKVVFGLDVSGSMSKEDIAEGLSVVNSCLKHAEILFVTFDTQITEVVGTLKRAKQIFTVHGRGGTDFNQIIDFAKKEKCDGVIIYTDGLADAPPKPRKLKVCWLLSDENKRPPSGVNWGHVVKLNRTCDYHW